MKLAPTYQEVPCKKGEASVKELDVRKGQGRVNAVAGGAVKCASICSILGVSGNTEPSGAAWPPLRGSHCSGG